MDTDRDPLTDARFRRCLGAEVSAEDHFAWCWLQALRSYGRRAASCAGVRLDILVFESGSLMARRQRIHYPGAVYHVMLRGNGGRDIFFYESDRIRFYDLLEEGVE